jgi:spermidine synthase
MNRWNRLDKAPVPATHSTMELYQRADSDEYAIHVDGRPLMNNKVHGSEDALAELACERMGKRADPRVLVGGLGMGFTLAAVLRAVAAAAQVVVAEVVPAIVEWNQGPAGAASGHPLKDARTAVFAGDVADAFRDQQQTWDAILLDVDNGPTGLTLSSNNWLYCWEGLAAAHRALRPDGVLGVWSAADDRAFTRRLQRAGFTVDPVPVRARGRKGGHRHIVWMAIRTGDAEVLS